MDLETTRRELSELQLRVKKLEGEIADAEPKPPWQASGYYTAYYATTGFMLGMFGAAASLLFNIVGAAMFEKHPLEIIRVYLTFPMGDKALDTDTGLTLAFGCCLYLATGMLLGIPFYLALTRFTSNSSVGARLVFASVLAIAIWLINYYGVLSWLQPMVVGMSKESLIVDRVPPWVAALTHLIFGWTMVLVYPLGLYVPYRQQAEQA